MGLALSRLAEEDPTFRAYTDVETGQTIIGGMGELHLEIIVDRLLREFKVEANVGKPQVHIKKPSATQPKWTSGMCANLAARASTAMSRSGWSPTKQAKATSSLIRLQAVQFQRSLFPR